MYISSIFQILVFVGFCGLVMSPQVPLGSSEEPQLLQNCF